MYKPRKRDLLKTARTVADFKFINEQIKAFNVNVLDEQGESLGTMKRYDALTLALDKGLDLVQVDYDRQKQISTARLMDLGKFLYDKKKKQKEKKEKSKTTTMKQIKLSYSTDDHDIERKIDKAKEFLAKGHLVKVSMFLKGREMIFKHKSRDKLLQVQGSLEGFGKPQFPRPKEERRGYFISLTPIRHG